jgi:hypothetical protein
MQFVFNIEINLISEPYRKIKLQNQHCTNEFHQKFTKNIINPKTLRN